jgi:predicted amidohydrolase
VQALFAFAFERAVSTLPGADLATLQRTPPGAIAALRWPEAAVLAALAPHLDALAQREPSARYRLRQPERLSLLDALGAGALEDGRRMLLLAYAIDEHFASFAEDAPAGVRAVAAAPPSFFAEASNAPPPIGQMTPLAVCRRWCRRFWYVGRTDGLESFGRIPVPVARVARERSRQTLQRACDEEELRVATVLWRRHAPDELRLSAAAAGCFAIGGLTRPRRAGLLEEVVDRLAGERVHLALLPELALDTDELATLTLTLRARARRFPALVVAGLAHRSAEGSASHVNEAVLLDAHGEELLRHEKLEPFTDGTLGLEDILPRCSNDYPYLDTPVGRIVLNICRDLRSDVPILLNRLLGVSVVLVPAYSKRLDFAMEEARILGARQRAMVVAVNPPSAALDDGAILYAPVRGSGGQLQLRQRDVPDGDVVIQVVRMAFRAGHEAFLGASSPVVV